MKIKKPKISVIMANYNCERDIIEAIESILNQTFKDLELIIINDNSTDNSLRIIKEYAKNDKRIIIINLKKNNGSAYARNKGLKIAKGKYIAIMDSDDISLPNRLKVEHNFLDKNKDIFLVGSRAININEKGEPINIPKTITDTERIIKTLPKENCIYHPTIMFRNEKTNFYREKFRYAQDYDFYLNLLSKNKILTNILDTLILYRLSGNSVSVKNAGKQKLFHNKALEFYKQRLSKGSDDYKRFNPDEILNLDINKTIKEDLLRLEISKSFVLGDYKKSLKFSKKYINLYGAFNKIGIYSILSSLGNKSKLFYKFNKFLLRCFG